MRKLRTCVALTVGGMVLMGASGALAASGGDSNAGDVWTDNVGEPAGPGHEMDPHLACQNINLWGAGLADSSGSFTIDGWPPSGTGTQAYAGTWSYTGSGTQIVAVINVQQLIAQAAANGDKPAKQGYHFKLQFVHDPQKHKTFWVNCPAPSPSPTPTSTPGPAGGTPGPTTSSHSGHRRTAHARRHRRHHLAKPKRHHRPDRRHVRHATRTRAVFTG